MYPAVDPYALMLARIQFAINISFHILFPSISIGLSWILLYLKVFWSKKYPSLDASFLFWIRVFALTFGLGAVSGATMSFQFGTNWPGFMKAASNVAGPLLAYETLTAFFLEASFLGIMLFAYHKVPRWVHTLSVTAVALGTTLSAFWVVSLNAWMHTPRGFHMENGKVIADSWLEIIFNPSQPYRLCHTLMGSLITAAFLVAGLSAWRLLKYPKDRSTRDMLKLGLCIASVALPIQAFIGDRHGINSLKHHPERIAAIEAIWETTAYAPLVMFADIDTVNRKNNYAIEIPNGSSYMLTHTAHGKVVGLNDFPEHPPVIPLFWGFRIMVGTAFLMLLCAWFGMWHMRSERKPHTWFLWIMTLMTFSGWVANLAGWYISEIGRQPYLVTGVLRTRDAAGPVDAQTITQSLIAYCVVYSLLLIAYIVTLAYLARKDPPQEA